MNKEQFKKSIHLLKEILELDFSKTVYVVVCYNYHTYIDKKQPCKCCKGKMFFKKFGKLYACQSCNGTGYNYKMDKFYSYRAVNNDYPIDIKLYYPKVKITMSCYNVEAAFATEQEALDYCRKKNKKYTDNGRWE